LAVGDDLATVGTRRGRSVHANAQNERRAIIEWRQDGIITMHHFGLTRTTRVVWQPRRRRDHRV
jgi:hypothetical protein